MIGVRNVRFSTIFSDDLLELAWKSTTLQGPSAD